MYNKEWNYKHNTIIGFSCNFHQYPRQYGKPLDVGILIEMKKKICSFYDYEMKKMITTGHNYSPPKITPISGKIRDNGAKIVAWLKRGHISAERGIAILNDGCIPIPDWIKE